MNENIQLITVATLLLGGCALEEDTFDLPEEAAPAEATPPAGGDELAVPESEAALVVDPLALIDKECFGAPLVGILDDPLADDCELNGLPVGWNTHRLFSKGSPKVSGLSLPVPRRMASYCRYEFTPGEMGWEQGYTELLDAVEDYGGMDLSTLSADCLAFGPMGGLDDDPTLNASLEQAFNLNIDNQQEWFNEHEFETADIALLDTVDHDSFFVDGDRPLNQHGLQMRGIIESISCSANVKRCEERVHDVLVTPRDLEYSSDWDQGGELGVISDFSVGLYYAVQSWRERMKAAGPEEHWRLVVNASVGADLQAAMAMDPSGGSMSSVVDSLRMAACYGVIVVGAAGNVRDEACPAGENGMLAPAKFESLLMPTLDTCMSLGFTPDWDLNKYPVFPPPGVDRPLIYAAGGVSGNDEPVDNARPFSEPRLVATAANGISNLSHLDPNPLTGTSVAAAVVSGTARLGWGIDPRQRPDEIMDAIYDSGWNTGRPAQDGLWAGDAARRVSVCAALEEISGGAFGCGARTPDADGYLGPFFAATEVIVGDSTTMTHSGETTRQAAVCDTASPTDFLEPQPEVPICPYCSAGLVDAGAGIEDDTVFLEIDPYYVGNINAAKLLLSTGEEIMFSSEIVAQLNDSMSPVEVHEVMFDGHGVMSASLQFKIFGKKSQTNTIPVVTYPSSP